MNKKRLKLPITQLLTLLIMLCLCFSTAHAQSASSADSAIDIAMERNGDQGKVLSVRERTTDNGQAYFMIKILHDGKVRIFKVEKDS